MKYLARAFRLGRTVAPIGITSYVMFFVGLCLALWSLRSLTLRRQAGQDSWPSGAMEGPSAQSVTDSELGAYYELHRTAHASPASYQVTALYFESRVFPDMREARRSPAAGEVRSLHRVLQRGAASPSIERPLPRPALPPLNAPLHRPRRARISLARSHHYRHAVRAHLYRTA